ncbi:hypothetical protein FB559_1410 [Actinoallomurus bryophytorum]|uniref:Uncharacterized protein n=1 Tax=Actinoallomurus bryophytorum TaxID=1490222 RepID=A0A543CFM0_9ACTN|nr:hypothetical protein [Actinoallomurus bryophytorum]TQL95898.1 hypothetical protein FB559_1410 [Actinoallomurus bryophytorum]
MLIFGLIIGIALCLQGVSALASFFRWRRLPIKSTTRQLAGVAYLCLGGMFILSAFWHQFYIGVFVALVALIVIQRKIIIQRRVASNSDR